MAAGIAQLSYLRDHPEAYEKLNETGDIFYTKLQRIVSDAGHAYPVNHIGSLGSLFFTDKTVTDYESAKTSDTKAYAGYCNFMLDHGVYLAPAQFEAMFLSMAHTSEQLDAVLDLAREYFSIKVRSLC